MPRIAALTLSMVILGITLTACGGGGGGGATGGGGTGGTPTDPGSLVYFTDYYPELKANVTYPATWRREIVGFDPNIIAAYYEPVTGSGDTFQENVALVTVPGSNLRDASGITGIQIVSSRAVTIDGLPGEEVIFDGNVPGVSGSFRFMEISYSQGANVFGLFYSAARDQFDRNREIVRYIARQLEAGKIVFDGLFLGSDLETPGNSPIASDGNNFLVVSCRESGDFPFPADLIARIISPDRSLLADEIVIHPDVAGNSGCRYTRPRITFDGTNFLVTYLTLIDDRLEIAARRVSPAGQLLDNTPINVSMNPVDAAFEPAAVFTGTRHLVVWHEDVSNDINDVVRGAFVDTDGSVSPSFVIFDELRTLYPDQFGNFLSRPEMAVGNNRVLVVLAPRFARDVRQPSQSLYAQLLDLDGNPQLPAPLLVREDTGDNPRYPQVAFDGQSFFVTWIEGLLEEGTISAGLFGIYGREVSETGQLINGDATTTGLTIAEPASDRPREDLNLTYADGRYYLLWSHTSFASDLGIYGTEVEAGTFAVQPERAVSATESTSYTSFFPRLSNPALAHGPTQKLVVWPARDGTVDAWIYD
jgi:hypothetical protein